MKNTLLFLLVMAVAVLGAVDWQQRQELAPRRLAAASLDQEKETRRLVVADREKAAEARAMDMARRPAARENRDGIAGSPGSATEAGSRAEEMNAKGEELRQAKLRYFAQLDEGYGGLFTKLGLSPGQIEQFKGILFEKRQAVLDAIEVASEHGISNDDSYREAVLSAVAPSTTALKETFGDQAYNEYLNYEHTLPARNAVTLLAQSLNGTPNPLTPEETAAMMRVLAQGAPPAIRGLEVVANIVGSAPTQITAEEIASSASILTSEQLQALKTLQQTQQVNQSRQTLIEILRRPPPPPKS